MKKRQFLRVVLVFSWILAALPLSLSHAALPNSASAVEKIPDYEPMRFLDQKIEKMKAEILQRKNLRAGHLEIDSPSTRNGWLEQLYKFHIVESGELTRNLTDKLIMGRLIQSFDGPKGEHFYPKTMGLKYFLEKNGLLDAKKNLIKDRARIEAAVKKEFPHGAIVKPAAGINSMGKSKGFYFKLEKFYDDLLKPDSVLYSADQFRTPFYPDLLRGHVASGEWLILQENVVTAAGSKKVLLTKEFKEARVHTFEDKVVKGATYKRWAEMDPLEDAMAAKVEAFVQDFLDTLPKEFLYRNAFSMDVAIMDNGIMRIIDVNTNRGMPEHWSGYLPQPRVLKWYVRHLEANNDIHFTGFDGFLLRNGLGNYLKYLKKYYIEGIR